MTQNTGHITPFLSIKDAAAYLGGLEPYNVRQLLEEGRIESRWVDGRRLVIRASLEVFADDLIKDA